MRVAVFLLMLMPAVCSAFEISIDVAPGIMNIQSLGQQVTIHTSVDFAEVDVASVFLNSVPVSSWKEDDRGYFVAKFLMEDVKSLPLIIDDYNTLKLVGMTLDDEEFWGEQEILVINVIPSGQ
ncbi:MAG: hypothetical protein HY885_09410 [Deltaproteobacteria bacterium]|nr:hypothetical protein [Deltaproteobacteria bacterium]